MTRITVNTEQVTQIAIQIGQSNQNLYDLLQDSRTKINNLSTVWSGQASQTTIENYNTFANKFFQTYYDVLNQYVDFLNKNVANNYFAVEQHNISLAAAFK